jgi:hypothetical protein
MKLENAVTINEEIISIHLLFARVSQLACIAGSSNNFLKECFNVGLTSCQRDLRKGSL